jgi:hypothetical protein
MIKIMSSANETGRTKINKLQCTATKNSQIKQYFPGE